MLKRLRHRKLLIKPLSEKRISSIKKLMKEGLRNRKLNVRHKCSKFKRWVLSEALTSRSKYWPARKRQSKKC